MARPVRSPKGQSLLAPTLFAAATGVILAFAGSAAVQAPAVGPGGWIVPRTADGQPDLQGNWTNGTLTPIQRPRDSESLILTAEQVEALEGRRAERIDESREPSDPEREAPPVGGDGSTGAAGGVGGYNYFWIEAGDRVAVFDGEPRSSLLVDPPNGRLPPTTPEGLARLRERQSRSAEFGAYDNPENRPLAERCIMSFGSNAGPPMLPNYFYNNNYTIVQTPGHVMIHTEMVHDTRVIRLGERSPLPPDVRPWMGDSWGLWEGDTLVVETTNIPEEQIFGGGSIYRAASDDLKVIERFTRADEHTINYEFTVEDAASYTAPYSGEVPFKAMGDLLYEYACHEGNYALFNILSGARAQERGSRNDRE